MKKFCKYLEGVEPFPGTTLESTPCVRVDPSVAYRDEYGDMACPGCMRDAEHMGGDWGVPLGEASGDWSAEAKKEQRPQYGDEIKLIVKKPRDEIELIADYISNYLDVCERLRGHARLKRSDWRSILTLLNDDSAVSHLPVCDVMNALTTLEAREE